MARLRSGKMNNAYQCMLDRLKKFNEWEKGYNKNLSIERRLDQYRILFDLGLGYRKDIVEKMHQSHLQALVEIKKALKNANEKGENIPKTQMDDFFEKRA